jgi:hypothetical protein
MKLAVDQVFELMGKDENQWEQRSKGEGRMMSSLFDS